MQKILHLSGIAGSGKTEYIKKTAKEFGSSSIIVTFSSKESPEQTGTVSVEWLIQRVFAENNYEKKILSDFLGIDIILNISKDVFKKNPTLHSLTKSSRFSSELYNLFGALKNNLITDEIFEETINRSNISEIDKNRLLLISEVYQKYNEFLKTNNLLDYRDAPALAANMQKNGITIQKYEFIAVDGVQDCSYAQLELIKMLGQNIVLCSDQNAKIRLTAGANVNLDNFECRYLEKSLRNQDIVSQSLYLTDKIISPTQNKTNCLIFEDTHEELSFICNEIKNCVTSGKDNFKDYAILIRDGSSKQKILDILMANEIPAGIEIYDENFNNFKIKLTRYLNLCMVFEKLNMDTFSKQDFEEIGVMPRSEREILFEELDLYFENILFDTIENSYPADRLLSIKQEHNKPSLLNVIYENISTLDENDRKQLAMELGSVAKIYELYKENRFTDIIFFCAAKEKDTIDATHPAMKMLAGKIKDIEYLYSDLLKTKPSLSALLDVINQPVERELKNTDFVRILPFFKTKGMSFKYVYIPFLTEKTMPASDRFTQFISQDANNIVSKEMQKTTPCFGKIIPDEETVLNEETALLYLGMTRAEEKLTISSHKYEDKKQIQPSIFFNRLKNINPETSTEIVTNKAEKEKEDAKTAPAQEEYDNSKVIPDNEILKLNASSIRNFQKCPKKYYLANLLNLREKKTFSSSYGSALHKIMQVFFENYLKQFNKETLLKIAEAYFNCAKAPDEAISAGFSEKDIETLLTSDALSIEEMHENFISAAEELEKNGFFQDVPDKALVEAEFHFKTEEIPDTEFDGRIDIITEKNGEFSLFDYKTGTQNKEFLSHYVSQNGVEFKTKTGRGNPEQIKKDYPYQVPLYFLATSYAKELQKYKEKLHTLGLKYIRPAFEGGYVDDTISSQALQEFSGQILKNLKTEVVDKIKDSTVFKPEKDNFMCQNCPYEFLCDGGDDD